MAAKQNPQFKNEQYAMMLNFLEDPKNNAKIWGVSGKTEVGVAPPRKIEAWKELAVVINNKYKGKWSLDHKSVADRWRTYFTRYKNTREKSNATGFGLTEEDKKRNIHTVQAKLDSMCPHYERIHALVGNRPNVVPAATFDSATINEDTNLNDILRFKEEVLPNMEGDFLEADGMFNLDENDQEPADHICLEESEDADDSPVVQRNVMSAGQIEDQVQQPSPALDTNPEVENLFGTDPDEASPTLARGTKRQSRDENKEAKNARKDRRKDFPSLKGIKNPTTGRNIFAQTIQESASLKAAALVTIEEKRIKFEREKWEVEREEREMRRREEREENELRRKEDEQKRKDILEEEKKLRHEDKVEKCRERRFALLQTLLAQGKSKADIDEFLAMLL